MTLKDMTDITGQNEQDAMRGMVLGAALGKLLEGEPFPIAGVALGMALGKWVGDGLPVAAHQEEALDKVLAVAAMLLAVRNAK
jgi:hypothetical protein